MVTATKVMRAARRSNQSPPPPAAPGGVTASARDAGVANQAPSLRCANSAASSPENSEPPPSPHPRQMERSERWVYDVDKERRLKLCRIEGCANGSVKGGVCCRHGAERKLCEVEGCANGSVNGGVCYRHVAERKLCEVEGCTNQSYFGGACCRHGAQRKLCEVGGCTDDAALATRTRRIVDAETTAAANFANVDPTDPRLVGLLRMHRRTAMSHAALRTIGAPREPSADPDEARGGATAGAAGRPPSAPPPPAAEAGRGPPAAAPERGEAAARREETAAPGVLRFRRILRSLRRVGFANRLANIRALALSGGDAGGAIQILLGRALTTVPSGVEDSEPGDGDHPSASATWRRRGGIHDEGVPEHDRECATTSRTRASLPDEQWFLYKLYAMLEYVVDTEHASAVSWINGGRAFAILDRVAFCEHVVPMFFRQTNFDSFTRQLNMWGFQRVLGKGPAIAAWRHKRFVRGKMEGLHLSRMRGPRAARRNRSPVTAIIPPR